MYAHNLSCSPCLKTAAFICYHTMGGGGRNCCIFIRCVLVTLYFISHNGLKADVDELTLKLDMLLIKSHEPSSDNTSTSRAE
jgi:hypothetical protein